MQAARRIQKARRRDGGEVWREIHRRAADRVLEAIGNRSAWFVLQFESAQRPKKWLSCEDIGNRQNATPARPGQNDPRQGM